MMLELSETLPGEKVVHRGRQWIVSSYGLEAPEHGYWIERERLRDGLDSWGGWPMHMASKVWVDLDDFIQCFLRACVYHGVSSKNMSQAIDRARSKRQQGEAFDAWLREHYPELPGSLGIICAFELHRRHEEFEEWYRTHGAAMFEQLPSLAELRAAVRVQPGPEGAA
jgi:hypothetical protein